MMQIAKKIIKQERYKDFTLLSNPIPFYDWADGEDFELVQLHSLMPSGENDIVGFCGIFSWKNNKLKNLDGDSYDEKMLVYGYHLFEDNKVDILVGDDW